MTIHALFETIAPWVEFGVDCVATLGLAIAGVCFIFAKIREGLARLKAGEPVEEVAKDVAEDIGAIVAGVNTRKEEPQEQEAKQNEVE
jgi:hypothetical protein